MMDSAGDPNVKLIRNEQLKLAAGLFNNIATAFAVTGFVLPLISLVYGTATPKDRYWVVYAVAWLVMSAANHQIASTFLSGMQS